MSTLLPNALLELGWRYADGTPSALEGTRDDLEIHVQNLNWVQMFKTAELMPARSIAALPLPIGGTLAQPPLFPTHFRPAPAVV